MFKRINKITALLVAAAAVVSLVPATGVNAAERLGTKDGTIENAIAFKDGKYIYEGYKSEDADQAIYFNDGEKDKLLEDLEDAEIKSIYGDKYAYAKDGDDEYLIDLSNGKVTDDETPEDKAESIETKLKSTLKKTDRYDDNTTAAAVKIDGVTFGDNWYQYAATPSGDGVENVVNTTITKRNGNTEEGNFLFGYTNESGKYVDVSRTANIYAYSFAKEKMVKVDEYNDYDEDARIGVRLTAQPKVLTQDNDYIYSLVKVKITTATAANAAEVKTNFENGDYTLNIETEATYLQKISKAQGTTKDGAYLPKSVDSYLVSETLFDDTDVDKAFDVLTDGVYGDASQDQYRVINNKLYVIGTTNGEVKVVTLNMKKIKENAKDSDLTDKKLDGYVVIKDDDSDHDTIETEDGDGKAAVSIDVKGNIWALDKGVILKFNGSNWKEVYTVDRSLNALNVYDENSIIAYEENGDVYTTVQEGAAVITPLQTGWVNTATGWTFYDAAGVQVVGSWVNAGGVWYMMKADGIMATGWYNDNGTWYYLNASGAMQTGWFNDNGTWYYLQSSGAMKTGWFNDNGTWYYLNASGAMQTGWVNNNGTWYYLQSSGAMKTGWLNDNGTWYYLQASGAMAANTTIDGYVLNASGAWVR